jgi:hypothetical protein
MPLLFAVGMLLSAASALTCGDCKTMQEVIHRSIVHNVSALETAALAGTKLTATVEIGQIIWHVCGSDAWKGLRYREPLAKACSEAVKQHVDRMTESWKDKATEEYKDPSIVLRMTRAICPHPEVGACEMSRLPSDYEPVRPDECAVCRALVSDLFGMVRRSRDRPTSAKSDAYYRLVGSMSAVCAELPMRHAIRASDREKVHELCEDVWDEHEAALSRLALRRGAEYAQGVCSDELEVCDEPTSLAELFAHDPTAEQADPAAKEEL